MKNYFKPAVEQLNSRLMMTATVLEVDAANDSESSAQEFSVPSDGNVEIRGTSVDKDDKDFFKVNAPRSGELSIHVSSTDGNVALEVKDRTGTEIFETEPNDGVNSGTVELEEGRTYYFRLRPKEDSPSDYSVSLAFGATDDSGSNNTGNSDPITGSVINESEPNDRKSQANGFDFDSAGKAQLNGVSDNSNDDDFFRFTASRTGQISVSVSGESNIAQFQIEDQAGQKVFETEPNDDVNSGKANVEAGKTYFARLRSKNDNAAAYSADLAFRQVGDSNGDQLFDTSDLVRIFQAGKFRTGEAATFDEGDWNDDGFFDEQDIILAFQSGRFSRT